MERELINRMHAAKLQSDIEVRLRKRKCLFIVLFLCLELLFHFPNCAFGSKKVKVKTKKLVFIVVLNFKNSMKLLNIGIIN